MTIHTVTLAIMYIYTHISETRHGDPGMDLPLDQCYSRHLPQSIGMYIHPLHLHNGLTPLL